MNVLEVLDAVIDGECMDTDVMLMQARAAVAELVYQMECNQGMIDHIKRCEQFFREGAGMATYEELMTWADNLMACVTPRAALNAAALAPFTGEPA